MESIDVSNSNCDNGMLEFNTTLNLPANVSTTQMKTPVTVIITKRKDCDISINNNLNVTIDNNRTDVKIINTTTFWFEVPVGNYTISISESTTSQLIDITKPIITNISSDGSVISWNSDDLSDSIVYYSTNSSLSLSEWEILDRNTTKTTDHRIKINLNEYVNNNINITGKIYYVVASTNDKYLTGWDDNNSYYFSTPVIRKINFIVNGISENTNFSNITSLSIEKLNYGKINFSESIDLSEGADIDRYVNISYNRIYINSTAISSLNKSATLVLYNLTFNNHRILKDGEVCSPIICQKISYSSDGNFTFTVTHFSVYSIEETPTISGDDSGGPSGARGMLTETYKEWSIIKEGTKKTMNIDEETIGLTKIEFEVDKEIENAKITVKKIKGNPVAEKPTGNVYQYLEISKNDLGDVKDISISFKVTKEWVESNKINKNLVYLSRYTDEWNKLPTEFVDEKDDFYYYESESEGFSYFVINGEICEPYSKSCSEDVLRECSSDGLTWNISEECEYGCSGNKCKEYSVILPISQSVKNNIRGNVLIIVFGSLVIVFLVIIIKKISHIKWKVK